MMGIKIIKYLLSVVTALSFMVAPARAEEPLPDRFRLAISGYFLTRYESNVSLSGTASGVGVSISPEETLGLDIANAVARIEGYYRIRPKHAITFSWYSINSTGSKSIEKDFGWTTPGGVDIVIPAGAQVDSTLNFDVFKVGYLWSFYRTEKVELSLGAGLHASQLKLGLNASTTIPSGQSAERVDTTIPLPVFSFALRYHVTPKYLWFLKTEAFAMKFNDWVGSYRDTTFGLEYRLWKHVALGAGLSSNSLEIEQDASSYRLKYDYTINGGLLYAAMYF
jgi:hypothetical protein